MAKEKMRFFVKIGLFSLDLGVNMGYNLAYGWLYIFCSPDMPCGGCVGVYLADYRTQDAADAGT